MSSTPLTDSINALTAYCNEVDGGTDTTLSDAVYTLASGYGVSDFNPFQYAYQINQLFARSELPETVTLDFTGNTKLSVFSDTFLNATGVKKIIIKNLVSTLATLNLAETFYYCNTVEEIEFQNCDFAPARFNRTFQCQNLKTITGEIDFTNATATYYAFAAGNLVDVRFKANTVKASLNNNELTSCSLLSDDSLVSIANGLSADVSGCTLALHATPLARCSTLMGTVTDGTFTADESGTVTLADFITNTKGWTLTS